MSVGAIFNDKWKKVIYTKRSLLGVSIETVLIDNSELKRIEQQIGFVKRILAGRALKNFRFSIADFRLDKVTALSRHLLRKFYSLPNPEIQNLKSRI